jgi:hypothetical protein
VPPYSRNFVTKSSFSISKDEQDKNISIGNIENWFDANISIRNIKHWLPWQNWLCSAIPELFV